MNRKLQVTLELESGLSNYELCEAVEQLLLNSSLNNSEYKLVVNEIKVVEPTHDNLPSTM